MKNSRGIRKIIIQKNFLFESNIVICSNNNEYFDLNLTLINQGMTKDEIIRDNIWKSLNYVNLKNYINSEYRTISAGEVETKYIEPNSIMRVIPINIIGIRNA